MSALTDGLREIADLFDSIPELPTPSFSGYKVSIGCHAASDPAAEVRRVALLIGGRWHKNDPNESDYNATYYLLTHDHKFGPFTLEIWAFRETVCVRKEVGVETVKHEARKAYVEKKPVYEWECVPLLQKVEELASPQSELEAVSS